MYCLWKVINFEDLHLLYFMPDWLASKILKMLILSNFRYSKGSDHSVPTKSHHASTAKVLSMYENVQDVIQDFWNKTISNFFSETF